MFDPPERVRYAQIPYSVNESPEHDRLAREMAHESIVLLKNDGVLPLREDVADASRSIGPNADELMSLLGNYYGTPSQPVTALAGIRAARAQAGAKVIYARAPTSSRAGRIRARSRRFDAQYLRPAAGSTEHGLKGEYFRGRELAGAPLVTRVDPSVDFRWYRGSPTSDLVARGEVRRRSRDRQRRLLGALDGADSPARLGRLHAVGHRRRRIPADRGRQAGDRRMDDGPARTREGGEGPARGRQGLRRAARVLRIDPRRRGAADLAIARRQAPVPTKRWTPPGRPTSSSSSAA